MKEQKLLVPLDSSTISSQTVKGLLAMKGRIDTPLCLLHVLDLELLAVRGFPEASFDAFSQRARNEAEQFLATQQQLFAAEGVATTTLLKEGNVRETISLLADSGAYDLLVIGRNPVSELRDLLLGQVANFLVHHVHCPVLIL